MKKETIEHPRSEIRQCKDIGMFVIDRPRTSCTHATQFCKDNCYNCKLENIFDLTNKDIRNETYWKQLTGQEVKKVLDRKRLQTDRFRFMTRGESFSDMSDVARVKDILLANPDRLMWLPTRAWHNTAIRNRIEAEIMPLSNACVFASIDPSDTQKQVDGIITRNWLTMFFGNDKDSPQPKPFKCPKTWKHIKGHCEHCKGGCFGKKRHIWLKQH